MAALKPADEGGTGWEGLKACPPTSSNYSSSINQYPVFLFSIMKIFSHVTILLSQVSLYVITMLSN